MTTDIEAIATQATGCLRDNFPGAPFCKIHDELGNPPWDRCLWVPVAAMLTERFREDVLLASVMRKILASSGYTNWGRFSAAYPYSITVDVNEVVITAEEMQAIDEAAPGS